MVKTAVVEQRQAAPPATQMPDFMRGDAGRGTEGWAASDYEMPRLALVQAISSDLLQTYDDLKPGDFFHTIGEIGLGPTLTITPIHLSRRYVLWCPRPPIDAGGILARADDARHWQPSNASFTVKINKRGDTVVWKTAKTVAESGLAEWGTYDPSDPKSPPAATEAHVVVVYIHEHPELSPVALLLQRSALPVARRLRGKLKFSSAPIFGTKFTMSSFDDDSPAGAFKNYRFTTAGFVEDADVYDQLKQMHDTFEKTGVQVRDIADAQEEEHGAADHGDAASETRY